MTTIRTIEDLKRNQQIDLAKYGIKQNESRCNLIKLRINENNALKSLLEYGYSSLRSFNIFYVTLYIEKGISVEDKLRHLSLNLSDLTQDHNNPDFKNTPRMLFNKKTVETEDKQICYGFIFVNKEAESKFNRYCIQSKNRSEKVRKTYYNLYEYAVIDETLGIKFSKELKKRTDKENYEYLKKQLDPTISTKDKNKKQPFIKTDYTMSKIEDREDITNTFKKAFGSVNSSEDLIIYLGRNPEKYH